MGANATKGSSASSAEDDRESAVDISIPLDSKFHSLLPYYLRDVSPGKRTLGNGAYAVVNEVEIKGKKCAAKQLHSILYDNATLKQREKMLQRFAEECKLLENVKHPNIVRFFGVHLEKGAHLPYLVMELLDTTLRLHLEDKGVPDPPIYFNIFSDVALGLRFLHQHSPPIIHRDLSANNVLLYRQTFKAKISDLGVAKVLDIPANQVGHLTKGPGTPLYMPPEATEDPPRYTTALDCFSFGILMIHTLSGDWPIPGPATRVDPDNRNKILPVTEFERREGDIEKIGFSHPLMPLMRKCLLNNQENRPSITTIVERLVTIQISQPHTTCAKALVCCNHAFKEPYELSVSKGDEVIVMRMKEGKRTKVMSLMTEEIGLVPSNILQGIHQLPLFIAMEDYASDCEENLSFLKGDLMRIINSSEEKWFALHQDTGKKGYVNSVFFKEKYEQIRCYFGFINHAMADSFLKSSSNGPGSFLVHHDSENICCLALRGQDCIKHYKIVHHDGSISINNINFKSLKSLITHYQHTMIEPSLLLSKYCSAQHGPLQPHVLYDGTFKNVISESLLCVVKEIEIGEKRFAGKLFNANFFSFNNAEEVHEAMLRFAEQCQMFKFIAHTNITEFHGVCFEDGCQIPYTVTDLFNSTLSSFLEKYGIPTPPTYYKILSDVAAGLQFLHNHSPPIVHQDLTARSIVICPPDRAKITDLGISLILKLTPIQKFQMSLVPEMLYSMPPEILGQEPKYSTASDCFSLGVIMIHTLCGMYPVLDERELRLSRLATSATINRRHQPNAYTKIIYHKHPLFDLIQACLGHDPKRRPSITTIVTTILNAMRKSFPMFVGISDHNAKKKNELSFKKGDVMFIIGTENENQWFAHLKNDGRRGYVPSQYLRKWLHFDEVWFFDNISKEEAEIQLLKSSNHSGTFLVRRSLSQPGKLALSIRRGDVVKHHLILFDGKKFFLNKRMQFKSMLELVSYYSKQPDGLSIPLMYPCQVQANLEPITVPQMDEWEMDQTEIKLTTKIWDGPCKELWSGIWRGVMPVAVKKLKSKVNISQDDFLQEASILKELTHTQLVQLYGVCTNGESPYIVLELFKDGNLRDFLREKGSSLKFPALINICKQLSEVMVHLEEKNCIHCDLAARNVLFNENSSCSLACFGMARDASGKANKIPSNRRDTNVTSDTDRIKWMAPEAARYNQFSIKSDVWSFGIVVYEIMAHGQSPYPEMTNRKVLKELERGYRMPPPPGCPSTIAKIMEHCWKSNPAERYTFAAINSLLVELSL